MVSNEGGEAELFRERDVTEEHTMLCFMIEMFKQKNLRNS